VKLTRAVKMKVIDWRDWLVCLTRIFPTWCAKPPWFWVGKTWRRCQELKSNLLNTKLCMSLTYFCVGRCANSYQMLRRYSLRKKICKPHEIVMFWELHLSHWISSWSCREQRPTWCSFLQKRWVKRLILRWAVLENGPSNIRAHVLQEFWMENLIDERWNIISLNWRTSLLMKRNFQCCFRVVCSGFLVKRNSSNKRRIRTVALIRVNTVGKPKLS